MASADAFLDDLPETKMSADAFLGDVQPINSRQQAVNDVLDRVASGEQSQLGGGLAVFGQGLGQQMDNIGSFISRNTPDTIKQGLGYVAGQASGLGQTISEALPGGVNSAIAGGANAVSGGIDNLNQNYPVTMSELSGVGNIANTIGAAIPAIRGAESALNVSKSAGSKALNAAKSRIVVEELAPRAKSTADVGKLASEAYDLADQQGGILSPTGINKAIDRANKIAPQTQEGRAFAGSNATTKAIEDLNQFRDKPISLKAYEEIDKDLSARIEKETDITGSTSEDGRNLIQIRQSLRDAAEEAADGDLVNAKGFESYRRGQQLYATKSRLADIDRIYQKAESAENPQTVIKNGFARLRDQGMRGYTDVEKEAIKKAAKTGIVTGALKTGGSRIISGIVGAGGGAAGGGVPGAILGATAAEGMAYPLRKAAAALQTAKGNKVKELLLNRPVVQESMAMTPQTLEQAFIAAKAKAMRARVNAINGQK